MWRFQVPFFFKEEATLFACNHFVNIFNNAVTCVVSCRLICDNLDEINNAKISGRHGGAVGKFLALHARDPIWAPVLIPAAPLPFQLPACGPGKQSRTAQSFGTLHPHRRPRRGSWLRIGIASIVALTWGVNHRMEDLPLCLSSLYIRLSNKKNNKNKSLNENVLLEKKY